MIMVDVPERISRKAYAALIETLGLDARRLHSLEFHRDGIYATVVALDENGNARLDYSLNEVVKHKVFIPVVDGLE